MLSKNPTQIALILAGGALLIWLLFFIGPELFDMHSTLALLAAIAIYVSAPFALLIVYRFTRPTKGKSND
jgi:integral membrane sensor domain MASE1